MIYNLYLLATSNLSVSGDLGELAAREEWGVMITCLAIVAVLMFVILVGVGFGLKTMLKMLHAALEGYNKLTVSIDRLSDSQTDLQEWLKTQTSTIKAELDETNKSVLQDHTLLLQHDETIKEHTTQLNKITKKGAK